MASSSSDDDDIMSDAGHHTMDELLDADGDAWMHRPSTPGNAAHQRPAEIEETPPSQRPRTRSRTRPHNAVTSDASNGAFASATATDVEENDEQLDEMRPPREDSPEIGEGSGDEWAESGAGGRQMGSSLDGIIKSSNEGASDGGNKLPEIVDWSVGQAPIAGQPSPEAQEDWSSEINSTRLSPDPAKKQILSEEEQTSKQPLLKRRQPSEELGSYFISGLEEFRPAKRARPVFKRAYLALLNEDIEHAASRCVPFRYRAPEQTAGELQTSQIGLSVWTPAEKERFFEALGRLGRDSAAGIAERVQTKGEMEVRQYIKLLQTALAIRRQQNELEPLTLAEFPAACELSEACCEALDDAADAIAERQGRFEDAVEEEVHGDDWLVSQDNLDDISGTKLKTEASQTTNIFNLHKWLSLSERFFMNAPAENGNWQLMNGGEDRPAIRLTTLEDFQSLAVTLTKRLVTATIYMTSSRLRSERGYKPKMVNEVKTKDVHAAAQSLGLAVTRPLLTECVKRLGLKVYEEPPKPDEFEESMPLSLGELEAALAIKRRPELHKGRRKMQSTALSSNETSSIASSVLGDSDSEGNLHDISMHGAIDSEEEEEVRQEAQEAIIYSAVDPPQSKRARQTLLRRIKAERAAERHADIVDALASYEEEKRMWEMLAREPPEPMVKPDPPSPVRKLRIPVDAGYSSGADWRGGV